MPKPNFDAQALLAAMRAEFAVVDRQYRALSDRHRGLQQVISGLETLLESGGVTAAVRHQAAPSGRADVARDRDTVTNVMAALRHIGRPLNAAEVQRAIEHGGVAYKRDTVYKALRRAEKQGLVYSENLRFALQPQAG
jgi:hypothetical protein